MSASGYTPIQLYYSTTASAVPVNTNLANGELAINITDGKLYYKDNSGVVKLLASNAGSSPVTSFQTSLSGLTPSTSTTGAITLAGTLGTSSGGTGLTTVGTNGQVLTSNGTTLSWASPSGTTGNNLTITTTGGAAAPATFNGSTAITIDYSTVGADQAGTAVAMAIALG
jgi:hypothetical protein